MTYQVAVAPSHLFARPLRGPVSYLAAAVAVAAPTLFRVALDPVLPGDFPFVTFHPFVLMAAVALEWRLALLVAVSCAFAGNYLFLTPRNDLALGTGPMIATLFMLLASAGTISVTTAYRKAIRAAAAPILPPLAETTRDAAAAVLPRAVGLSLALVVSLGMWAAIGVLVTRLL